MRERGNVAKSDGAMPTKRRGLGKEQPLPHNRMGVVATANPWRGATTVIRRPLQTAVGQGTIGISGFGGDR
jgi:hypothetical protein